MCGDVKNKNMHCLQGEKQEYTLNHTEEKISWLYTKDLKLVSKSQIFFSDKFMTKYHRNE